MAEHDKKVDEDWKRRVRAERAAEPAPIRAPGPIPGASFGRAAGAAAPYELEPSFLALVSSLAMQALVAMGHQPDASGGGPEKDLVHAQFCVDLLGILEEKTRGNLTAQEERTLASTLHELRMLFVEASMPPGKG